MLAHTDSRQTPIHQQVMPYLNFTRDDPGLAALICNLARRQAYSIVHVRAYRYCSDLTGGSSLGSCCIW